VGLGGGGGCEWRWEWNVGCAIWGVILYTYGCVNTKRYIIC